MYPQQSGPQRSRGSWYMLKHILLSGKGVAQPLPPNEFSNEGVEEDENKIHYH